MKDKYWHLQMHLPEGKGGTRIRSIDMLKEKQPIIGTGEWDDDQCRNFKGQKDGIAIGDIVMVREGSQPIALCRVTGENFTDKKLEEKYININHRHVEVLGWAAHDEWNPLFTQGTLKKLYKRSNTQSYIYINEWYKHILNQAQMNEIINTLKYKHQIILQGAPGTGKTFQAKKIATKITSENEPIKISGNEIVKHLFPGREIATVIGKSKYKVEKVDDKLEIVEIKLRNGSFDKIIFQSIIDSYENQQWHQPIDNAQKRRVTALAKFIFDQQATMKLVQFHPSYTYEDFVRGIVVENENGALNYVSKDKTLALFAKDAFENYRCHRSSLVMPEITHEDLKQFKEYIKKTYLDKKTKFVLGKTSAFVVAIHENGLDKGRVEYDIKGGSGNLNDKTIMKVALNNDKVSIVNDLKNLDLDNPGQNSYYFAFNQAFQAFVKAKHKIVPLRNYVLIVDEINRANLPAVLGELIYALEYRGEKVESMYAVDGDSGLTLPPNLYIIGTMNTADRSVGQIDYAIRRRFAFIDVLPKDLSGELGAGFKSTEFKKVKDLFTDEYLSNEFEAKDVQLGHSYFIQQYEKDENGITDKSRPMDFKIRLEYEIKPILREYVRDGILKENAKVKIEEL